MKNKSLLIAGILVILETISLIIFFVFAGQKKYIITFDSDGGSVIESQSVKEGDYAIKPTDPVKEKYAFVEWLRDGRTFNFNTVIETDINLVAKWKKVILDEFEITIDENNGEKTRKVKVLENEKLEKPEDPKYKGYIFKGWFVDSLEYDFDKEVVESFTIKAKWEKEKEKYTVTFDSNGGSKVDKQQITEGEKATKPEDPIKEDNKFIEWQLNNKSYDFDTEVTKNITLKAKWETINYVNYKGESFYLNCYMQGTSTVPSKIKPGDKLECSINYEVYAEDAISTLKYNLSYGKGLKLIKSENIEEAKVNNGNYQFTYSKPLGVRNVGRFFFEVLDMDDYTNSINYTVKVESIKFVTKNKAYYSHKSLEKSYMSIWESMNSSHVYTDGGFTINCVNSNNQPITTVINGDIITCEAYLEVKTGDEIQYLKYSYSSGSSIETTKIETPDGINKINDGTFHYMAKNPVNKLYLGKKTFKINNENNTHMLFVYINGTFITKNGYTYTPADKEYSFKNGNTTKLNEFKSVATNIIDKGRNDLIVENKLEKGFYYITSGTVKTSPIMGNINYYKEECSTKIGSTLCKSSNSLKCSSANASFIEVKKNNDLYQYSICLTAGGDNIYINGTEAELLDANNFSVIKYPE